MDHIYFSTGQKDLAIHFLLVFQPTSKTPFKSEDLPQRQPAKIKVQVIT
jgi:hypothetical protein